MRDELLEISSPSRVDQRYLADISFALGDADSGFAVLDKAYADHDQEIMTLKGDPVYDPFRSDPRYSSLVRRLRLP
jgi:hypothetical protein